jgi:hypothetical protein
MSDSLRVIIPDGGRAAELARVVLSSLPLSYAPNGEHRPGAVIIVDGQTAAWPDAVAAAIKESAAGVVVVEPQPAELGRLLNLLDQHPMPVVIDSRWTTNPVIPAAVDAFATAVTSGSRLECRVITPIGHDLYAALVDQLSLVRRLGGPAADVRMILKSDRGYFAQTSVGDLTVDLSVICTGAKPESATVRLLTLDGSVELFLPSGDTAQPARLITVGPDGAIETPALYESGHRTSWRRLQELINTGQTALDLQDLAADIATTHQIRPPAGEHKKEHTT